MEEIGLGFVEDKGKYRGRVNLSFLWRWLLEFVNLEVFWGYGFLVLYGLDFYGIYCIIIIFEC